MKHISQKTMKNNNENDENSIVEAAKLNYAALAQLMIAKSFTKINSK